MIYRRRSESNTIIYRRLQIQNNNNTALEFAFKLATHLSRHSYNTRGRCREIAIILRTFFYTRLF